MNKLSHYSHLIETQGRHYICNVANGCVFTLNPRLSQLIENHREDIDVLEHIHPDLLNALHNSGMIIDSDSDEASEVISNMLCKDDNPKSFDLIINPTLDCNLRCWYCYETHGKGTVMSEDTMKRVKLLITNKVSKPEMRQFNISFFGGEPLLQWDNVVIPLISHTLESSKNTPVKVLTSFTTNGVLLTEEKFERLQSMGLNDTSFQISIDGNRAFHDSSRIGALKHPTFDTIMANVVTGASKGFDMSLRFNYTPTTIDSFLDVLSLLEELPPDTRTNIRCSFHQVWQTTDRDTSIKDKADRISELYLGSGLKTVTDRTYNRYVCYADRTTSCLINYNGDVYKCTAREFTPQSREGVIMPDGSIEWNSKYHNRMKCRFSNTVCNRCDIMPICNAGCTQNKIECTVMAGCPKEMTIAKKKEYLTGWLRSRLKLIETT